MNDITNEQFDQFLVNNKLDFMVKMEAQYITVPAISDQGFLIPGTEKKVHTGYCPVRTDTMQPLSKGGLSVGFKPIQNYEALSIIPQLSKTVDLDLVKGSTWGNGAGVYAQISLGDMQVGNNRDDKIGKYLTVINSHDGSSSMKVLITPLRMFCQNQITAMTANANATNMITIRHNANATERLDELINSMRIVNESFEYTEEIYNQLATRKVDIDHVDEVLKKLFPLAPDAGVRTVNNNKRQLEAVANRYQYADGGRIERDTAWNLYNSIQGTFQHDGRDTEGKDKSILMGSIAQKSASSLSAVLEYTSSQHISSSVMDEIDRLTL